MPGCCLEPEVPAYIIDEDNNSVPKIFLIFLSILFTSGCVGVQNVSRMKEGPLSENNITIMRNYNFVGSGAHYWPTVDGQVVAGIFGKQYVSFQLNPGRHLLGSRWGNEIEVEIKENEKRFFLMSPSLFRSEIEEIDNKEAEKRLQGYKRISTGHVSNCQGVSVPFEESKDRLCFSTIKP